MVIMGMLFFLLIFVFIICLIIGLIKPTIFSRFLGEGITRKKIAKIFSIATVVSFVLLAITAINTPKKQVAETQPNNVAAPNVTKEKTDSAKIEKQVAKNQPTTENTSNQETQPKLPEKPAKIPSTKNQELTADEARKTGLKYYNGEGVKQDYQEALKLFRKAADQGDARAQYNVGLMYDNGTGVAQNHTEALKWYKKAADQGDASAQYNVGLMYDNGTGVAQNHTEALKWYKKAADQGDTDAQSAIKNSSGELKTNNKLTKADADEIAALAKKIYDNTSGEKETKQLRRILNGEADVNDRDENGDTILMNVCHVHKFREKAYELVNFLLAKGADVNASNNKGWTPLIFASTYQLPEVVKLFLVKGADVNARTSKGGTALINVCMLPQSEEVGMVKLFLDRGADVNAKHENGMTPLIYASKGGHSKIVNLLLDKGVDVNAKDKRDWTSLLYASMFDHIEVAKLLLAKGADANANVKGVITPMSYAKPEMAKLLKEYGAVDKPR